MPLPMSASQVMNREFLEVRAKILELAAAFDRLDRADGELVDDPRVERISRAISILTQHRDDRAEQVQMIFSRSYEEGWRDSFFGAKK